MNYTLTCLNSYINNSDSREQDLCIVSLNGPIVPAPDDDR